MRGAFLVTVSIFVGFSITLGACESKPESSSNSTPASPAADPKRECLDAMPKLYAKMRKCDLKVDDIDPKTLCDGGTPAANVRAMTSMSCDALTQLLTADLK